MKRGPQQAKTDNTHGKQMDKLLNERPVTITWRRKPNGILVAVHVDDPHGDPVGTGAATANYRAWQKRQREEPRAWGQKRSSVFPVACVNGHEFDSWNTMVSADGEPHCRTCASPQDTQLLSAARTDI